MWPVTQTSCIFSSSSSSAFKQKTKTKRALFPQGKDCGHFCVDMDMNATWW